MGKKNQYQQWIAENEKEMKTEALKYQPLFSIFLFNAGILEKQQKACKKSIENQIYQNWELVVVPEKLNKNIREQIQGEYILFVSGQDLLAPNALQEMAGMLNESKQLDIIYSDEDCVSFNGKRRFNPFFKPDWSPDLFWCMNYVNQLAIYRTTVAQKAWSRMGDRDYPLETWLYDFQMHFFEYTDASKIGHIAKILYHTRQSKEVEKEEILSKKLEQRTNIKQEALERRGIRAKLEPVEKIQGSCIVYEVQEQPVISIIIPSKDNVVMLRQCLESMEASSYRNYEIILVDNGSSPENRERIENYIAGKNIRYCYEKMEFNFSRMCNWGAAQAAGEYLLFLNDDIEISQSDWLERLVGQGAQETTGAVGAKLLYPGSDLIQHVGVANMKMGLSHYLMGLSDAQSYYFGRNMLNYNCLAVTGACLLVNKNKFYEAGGFDEELQVSFNDVDLCFKLYEAGYYNVVRNDVCLYHHESVSRGRDTADRKKMERLIIESRKLWEHHPGFAERDPFYSKHLVQDKTDFSLNLYGKSLELSRRIRIPENLERIEGTFLTNIDTVVVDETIQIRGWYYWKNDQWTRWSKAYLILKDSKGACVCYSTCPQERKDVAEALQNQAVDCGFRSRIPKEDPVLSSKAYQIGVMIESFLMGIRRVRWTEVWLEI